MVYDYPWYTPYQFSGNTPIMSIEMEGLQPIVEGGKLVGYTVRAGFGPTQIAEDINNPATQKRKGYTLVKPISWQQIVIDNVEYYGEAGHWGDSDMLDVNNPVYRRLDSNTGEKLDIFLPDNDGGDDLDVPNYDNTIDDLISSLGLLATIGSEAYYSKVFNSWLDKTGQMRSQNWGGNGYTGGKNKFGRTTSKVLGGVNYLAGVYNVGAIEKEVEQGLISRAEANGHQINNVITTVTPPLISIPWSVGSYHGEKKADKLARFSVWFNENITFRFLMDKPKNWDSELMQKELDEYVRRRNEQQDGSDGGG